VDEKQQVISCKVSDEEAEAIKAAAAALSISVSEYVRNRALSRASETSAPNLETLLHYLMYMINRLHVAVFSIPEVAGTLSTEQLQTIYDSAGTEAVEWMNGLPEHMGKLQTRMNTVAPAPEKGAA
jgi:hypothetical protein